MVSRRLVFIWFIYLQTSDQLFLFSQQEGIFRRSGVKSRINILFNSNVSQNMSTSSSSQSLESLLDEACAYDVADFLKGMYCCISFFSATDGLFVTHFTGWFRNQDPLLSAKTVSLLTPLIGNSDPHLQDLNALRALLLVLPNRLALETLLRFLSRFAAKSDENSMTSTNLAIVWTPTVCRESMSSSISSSKDISVNGNAYQVLNSSSSSASLLESVSNFMKEARSVLLFLLENVDLVFSIPKQDLQTLMSSVTLLPRSMISNVGPSIPAIGCRASRIIHASPYEVFLKIVIERVSWDPLMVSSVDEGSTQKVRHSFSKFLPNPGSIRIQRKLVNPSPYDSTIEIHEESMDDSRVYCCEWLITSASSPSAVSSSSSSSSSSNSCSQVPSSSEVTLSFCCDLKGRPFIWYKMSYPKLLEHYLNRINDSFPSSSSSKDKSGRSVTDPFSCCFFMKTAVNA